MKIHLGVTIESKELVEYIVALGADDAIRLIKDIESEMADYDFTSRLADFFAGKIVEYNEA